MSLNLGKYRRKKKKIMLNEELYSASTNDRNYDLNTISTLEKERISKNKTVSFGNVRIIEVESYKKYNKISILTFEKIESSCMKCCDDCKCGIF